MEPIPDLTKHKQKIYKDRAIWVATFLGGPLAAGYLISENFKAFDEETKAQKTWLYTIAATVIIFGGIYLIPDTVRIPNQIIPIMYTALAYYLVQHYQGENIKAHTHSGGEFHGWWRTIGVGVIGLAITLVAIIMGIFLFDILTM